MSDRIRDLLPEYVLGGLSADETAEVERALAESRELRAEADTLAEDLTGLAVALPPVPPSPDIASRLTKSVKRDRFLPFADELARFCDVTFERMKDILRLVDSPDAWEQGPLPGIRLIHFEHGPASVGADTGFVEMAPGFEFPKHSHGGREINYVLEGALIDDDGTVYGPGTFLEKVPPQVHTFSVSPDEKLVMVVINNGYEILMG